jgi:HAD superfamily hydrolase (TIGR01549 family)
MAYDAILFDHDGVLLEVDYDPARSFEPEVRQLLAGFGVQDPDGDDVEELASLGDPARKRAVCESYGISVEEFWRRRERRSLEYQKEMIRRGEKELYTDFNAVEMLYDSFEMGVVSNNQRRFVQFVLQRFDVEYLFETVHGRGEAWTDLDRLKPDTYYIRQAMDAIGAEDVLYVGDSWVDVEAAERAGLDSAFIRRQHREGYELRTEPTYELAGLHGLQEVIG